MTAWAWVLLLSAAWGAAIGYVLNLVVTVARANQQIRWCTMLVRAICLHRWTLN